MRALVDAFITALQDPLPEIGADGRRGWTLTKYQKPILRSGTGVAVYPVDEVATPETSDYDFLNVRVGLEYWEPASREAETLLRDQTAAAAWMDLHERFKDAVYSLVRLEDVDCWDVRYEGTDFAVDTEAIVRVFRLRVLLKVVSPQL